MEGENLQELVRKQAEIIKKQAETIARLEARIIELETVITRLQKDSRNSSSRSVRNGSPHPRTS